MTGFNSAQDCTYESGLNWLKDKFPEENITTTKSVISNCLYVIVNGTIALKQEAKAKFGYKLCGDFVFQWNRDNMR